MTFFTEVKEAIRGKNRTIVFPEGEEIRILEAAVRLAQEGIIRPIVLGNEKRIRELAESNGHSLDTVHIIDPNTSEKIETFANEIVRIRRGKTTLEQAKELLQQVNYFGTMMVATGEADGLVSGAVHTTADTVRPALQLIKTKPGIQKTSGAFIMVRGEERYIFADCAITIAPTDDGLAEIAVLSAATARAFGINPKVALLSFSTKGSADSDETQKVASATTKAREMDKSTPFDGELQFDAAFVPAVAKQKAPDSIVAGAANVFVFPSLEAGNISYKLVQRLAGFEAVGPILQGLNKPVNDLSRGCSADDVYHLALLTAAQVEG
ncbi:phosphate acetyltransferase [Paenisporosarcina cavernae]|uniref:Phosphate acetyltransferase n=1 Tax=Paenisporosarcina cavernae TaxID=2320858 RepID=A0A385YQV9_9BACL|nr:phosphate acetyltransferase [Paenisporosarcina cavernae]AYC28780.1 phosphate acetyltransferase [Paenisporosarcina cavernae]